MEEPQSGDVTRLLDAWREGDEAALTQLMPIVYGELRRMAGQQLGRGSAQTLQATALIHDAYLRLVQNPAKKWQNRSHFFAVCATAMRHILVDHARSRHSAKRGGPDRALSLDNVVDLSAERAAEVLALDAALTELKALHPRQSSVVECRYFGGLTVEETAEALAVSPETVMRDWKMAKAWLYGVLSAGDGG
jgi:RNA polymerase sigma factor (TIGR02999 family)